MNQEQAIRHIKATGLFGKWLRRMAIRELSRSRTPEAMMILASALNNVHSHNFFILEVLNRMALEQGEDGIETLWKTWVAYPQPALAELLTRIGWPHGRPLDKRLAQTILAIINEQTLAPATLTAILRLIEFLPKGDAAINDSLYAAWIYSQSNELEQIIDKPEHRVGSPAMEVLHSLVTGQLDRYWRLHDQNEQFLTQAIQLAPPEFLKRITHVVSQAQDAKLREIYRKALIQTRLEFTQLLHHLKAIGDEIGLFEQIPKMNLQQVLELCERWISCSNLIDKISALPSIQIALDAYCNIKTLRTNSGPVLPKNTMNIFTYWQNNCEDNHYRSSNDPLVCARTLYLNPKTITKKTKTQSKHWLEQLVISLTDTIEINIDINSVCWLSICKEDAILLQTNIGGTPADYLHNTELLKNSNEFTSTRTIGLLIILCTFQAAFIGTEITVETIREPLENTAIRLEEVTVA